jgi:Beta-propeller repeat
MTHDVYTLENILNITTKQLVLLTSIALLVLLTACGQSPNTEVGLEPDDFGTAQLDDGYDVAANARGVFVTGDTAGRLDGNNVGGSDGFVRRYNGGKIWGKQFGTTADDFGYYIDVDTSGNSYVLGDTGGALTGTSLGGVDVFLQKYNLAGVLQWTKQFGANGDDDAWDVAVDNASNIVVLTSDTADNFNLRTFSSAGVLLQNKAVNDTTKPGLKPDALTVDAQNNVIVLTEWNNGPQGRDLLLYKYSSTFTPVWQKAYATAFEDVGFSLTTDSAGNIHFILRALSDTLGFGGRYVKMDSNGTVLFTRQLEPALTSNNTAPFDITTDSAGNVYITGVTGGAFKGFTRAGGLYDIVVFKYDSVGTRVWLTQFGQGNYGSSDNDYAYGIAVSDAVYVIGVTYGNLLGQPKYSSDPNDADAFLAQLNSATGLILGIDQ